MLSNWCNSLNHHDVAEQIIILNGLWKQVFKVKIWANLDFTSPHRLWATVMDEFGHEILPRNLESEGESMAEKFEW